MKQPNILPADLGQDHSPHADPRRRPRPHPHRTYVEIFNALPKGELGIFPNSTHAAPYNNSDLFNATIERFLAETYKPIDLVPDTMGALGEMEARLQAQRAGK